MKEFPLEKREYRASDRYYAIITVLLKKIGYFGSREKVRKMKSSRLPSGTGYIAHRDDTEKEQAVVFMKLPKEKDLGENVEYQIRSRKLQSPGVNVLQTYIDLFSVLSEIVELKIQKHNQKAHSDFIEQVPSERSHFF